MAGWKDTVEDVPPKASGWKSTIEDVPGTEGTAETVAPRAASEPPLPLSQIPYSPDVYPPGSQSLVESMDPLVSGTDRAWMQNFISDQKAQQKFLQERYPGFDVQPFTKEQVDVQPKAALSLQMGRGDPFSSPAAADAAPLPHTRTSLYTRPKNASPAAAWRAVTPAPQGLEDLPQLAADNAYPIGVAALQGILGAGAGAAVGPAAKGVGSLLPLLAAGATQAGTGAAGEVGKQVVSNAYLGSGEGYHGTPVAGAAAAGAVTPLLFGTGATPGQAAENMTPWASQRGIPSRLATGATTGLSSIFSGIPKAEIENAVANLGEVKALEKGGQAAIDQKVRQSMSQVREGLFAHQDFLGNRMAEVLDGASQGVDISGAKAPLKEQIDRLTKMQGTAAFTAPRQAELDAVTKLYRDHFGHMANVPDPATGVVAPQWIEKSDVVPAREALLLQKDLQGPEFSNFVSGRQNVDRYGNMSDFDKTIQRAGSSGYEAIGKGLDKATEEAAGKLGNGRTLQQLKTDYAQLKDTQNYLRPFMKSGLQAEEKAQNILGNLGSRGKGKMRDQLLQLDKATGSQVVPNANVLSAFKTFGDSAATDMLSGFGSTSTSKSNTARFLGRGIGGALGYGVGGALGHEYAGAMAGDRIGGAVVPWLSSPARLRNYMGIGAAVRGASQPLINPGGLSLGLRPFHMMSNEVLPSWLGMGNDESK